MKYTVDVVGRFGYTVSVEAETREEAELKGRYLYESAGIEEFMFSEEEIDVFEED